MSKAFIIFLILVLWLVVVVIVPCAIAYKETEKKHKSFSEQEINDGQGRKGTVRTYTQSSYGAITVDWHNDPR